MPYIKKVDREKFDAVLSKFVETMPVNEGEFNYLISSMLNILFEGTSKNYAAVNNLMGVLECAKLEFYRRVAAPYEDKKTIENGDVYVSKK